MQYYHPWTPSGALTPLLSTILAIAYALCILAYPPRHRTLAFLALCVPVALAFKNQLHLTPWFTINDTFGRFLYIWLAHMSHSLVLSGPRPPSTSNDRRRVRFRKAYKQLFARHAPNATPGPRRGRTHTLTRLRFCIHHLAQATRMLSALYLWDTYLDAPSLSTFPRLHASLLRRLPASLNAAELLARLRMTVSVCAGDMLYFEAVHSLFAVLFVGVLRLDGPGEWGTMLFGSVADCWSVRRYWSVYWHDYVYVSFSALGKVLVRGILRITTPSAARRALENAVVFVVSGALHSLVGWVQTGGEGEVCCVAVWYAAQVLALVGEGVVARLWTGSVVRGWLEERVGKEGVLMLERGVGYVWVFCWMFWSVPKYLITRNAWEMENFRRKSTVAFADGR